MFGVLVRGLRPLFRKSRAEREMEAEMRFHIEMETERNRALGMGPDEARRAALVAFGGVESAKEQCREVWLSRAVESFVQDVRYGLRSARRNPGYAAVVVLTLALGIGANSAIFSAVNGVLLQSLPYRDDERLVTVFQQAARRGPERIGFSPKEVADYRARAETAEQIEEFHSMMFILLGTGEPERVRTGVVSAGYFDMLGVRPVLGRTFEPADDQPGAPPVLVLGHDYWRERHGGDKSIVGREFRMNDRVHTVVGVLPPLPEYPEQTDVFMATSACPFRSSASTIENRNARMSSLFARLAPGVTVEQARADFARVQAGLAAEYPDAYPEEVGPAVGLAPLREEMTAEARPTFLLLLGTTGLVLLIACANVANLAYARMGRRERELGIRAALGAGGGRLARQLLTESALLAVAGGAVGLVLAAAGHGLLVAFAARFTPRAAEIEVDAAVLAFTLVVSVAAGLLVGFLPALPTRRRLADAIGTGAGQVTAGRHRARVRDALVVLQVAVSFALLVGAGLMLRSLVRLQEVDPGFSPERVLNVDVPLSWSKYEGVDSRKRFFRELLARVEADPRVISAAVSTTVPLDEPQPWLRTVRFEGLPEPDGAPSPQVDYRVVSPDYFRTMGIPLVDGRLFADGDVEESEQVAVVNRTAARRFWGEQSPVGRRVQLETDGPWITVVGVVGDVKQYGLDREPAVEVYRPFEQVGYGYRILARTTSDPESLARDARAMVWAIDPEQPVTNVQTLEHVRSESLSPSRLTAVLLGLFAAVALAITAAGVGGSLALWVSQRTREIGVRLAMGATPAGMLRLAMRQGLGLVVAGIAVGAAGALMLANLISGWLFGVEPTDPVTYASVSLVLAAAAAAACFVPAYRAASVDPMTTLRTE